MLKRMLSVSLAFGLFINACSCCTFAAKKDMETPMQTVFGVEQNIKWELEEPEWGANPTVGSTRGVYYSGVGKIKLTDQAKLLMPKDAYISVCLKENKKEGFFVSLKNKVVDAAKWPTKSPANLTNTVLGSGLAVGAIKGPVGKFLANLVANLPKIIANTIKTGGQLTVNSLKAITAYAKIFDDNEIHTIKNYILFFLSVIVGQFVFDEFFSNKLPKVTDDDFNEFFIPGVEPKNRYLIMPWTWANPKQEKVKFGIVVTDKKEENSFNEVTIKENQKKSGKDLEKAQENKRKQLDAKGLISGEVYDNGYGFGNEKCLEDELYRYKFVYSQKEVEAAKQGNDLANINAIARWAQTEVITSGEIGRLSLENPEMTFRYIINGEDADKISLMLNSGMKFGRATPVMFEGKYVVPLPERLQNPVNEGIIADIKSTPEANSSEIRKFYDRVLKSPKKLVEILKKVPAAGGGG